ncbi:MAG: hypothetical protein SGARI_008013 [Bacillariaceae sp.]
MGHFSGIVNSVFVVGTIPALHWTTHSLLDDFDIRTAVLAGVAISIDSMAQDKDSCCIASLTSSSTNSVSFKVLPSSVTDSAKAVVTSNLVTPFNRTDPQAKTANKSARVSAVKVKQGGR